ncbi:MAG TPA: SprT-like domain-containing protein [Bacteroidia bacterium]|nr:SprT-like domain-containing protein [Bacteroidia bacterium]HRD37956.1 SprT-like domain-containing protein [Bacteroidia bacterium]
MTARELQFQKNCEVLKKYIPEGAVETIARWIVDFDFKLKIKKERSTKLGDYSSPQNGMNHVITINHNLNKYSFLVTLVHEVAHLSTFNKFKNTVAPHGQEWKNEFKILMQPFLVTEIFPVDVLYAIRNYLQNPAASSCTDTNLLRTLKLYDENTRQIFLEYLPYKSVFLYNGNKVFEKGERIRKRFRCIEIATGTVYLFNPLTEVELFEELAKN